MRKIILNGGGPSAFEMLESLKECGIYENTDVAYVVMALEYSKDIINDLKNDSGPYIDRLKTLGARSAKIIFSDNFDEMFECQSIIIGGGKTDLLLKTFKELDFEKKLGASEVHYVAGSSAGALALSRKGLGTRNGEPFLYYGLGLIDAFIVPHSDAEKKDRYPDALHLDDYQSVLFLLG